MSIMTAKQISELLAQRADAVACNLLPKGKRESNEWRVGSLDGEEGKSLGVCLSGGKAGVWSDFSTGESGDLLDLWANIRKISLREAIKEAKKWLGVSDVSLRVKEKKFTRPAAPEKNTDDSSRRAVFNYLTAERNISPETIKKFKLSATSNEEIIFPFYREEELINLKFLSIHRPDGKKKMRVAKNAEPILFGWQALDKNTRSIVLTEGEIDTLSLAEYGYQSLSLPFGAGKENKQQWLEYEFESLAIFDEIYLCFDNDVHGQETINELLPRLGAHRCKIVTLPLKDANECLQKNIPVEEIKKCFDEAVIIVPKELKKALNFVDDVIDEIYPSDQKQKGVLPPWRKAEGKILFRPNELSMWTGINGHGKSQMLGQIVLNTLKSGDRVCIASLELKPARFLSRLIRQASGLATPSVEYIREIHRWYDDNLWIFDLLGTTKKEKLMEVFLYARQRYGVNHFVIDSLMKCGIAEDDFNQQKLFIEELCDFKNQYDCHIHLVVHPRKGADESHVPGKLDIKGSGSVSDLADNCFSVWRNKQKENEIQKAVNNGYEADDETLKKFDCYLTCDKQRNGDWEGVIGLWFDKNSFQFIEKYEARPIPFVQYSNKQRSEL